jgi:membrane protease YdiL (CAAX protease family)
MAKPQRPVLELCVFLLGTFVPLILLGLYAAKVGGLAKAGWVTPLGMLTPMLSAMLVQKLIAKQRIKDLGFSWGRWRWWFLAPLGFGILIAASLVLSVIVHPAILADASTIAKNLSHSPLLPHHLPLEQQLAVAFAITIFIGPILNLPIFLGEEVGWRGFMNPRLISLFGRPGLLIGGAIWAVWHLPLILVGHNYPHHPWLGLALWIPICIALNILLAAAFRAGRSIFPAALSHGIINQLAMLTMGMLMVESRYDELLDGPAGLIGLAVLILPAALVYRRGIKEAAQA